MQVPCSSWSWDVTRDRAQPRCHNGSSSLENCSDDCLHLSYGELLEWHESHEAELPPFTLFPQGAKVLVLGDTYFQFTTALLTRHQGSVVDLVATTFQRRQLVEEAPNEWQRQGLASAQQAGLLGIGFAVTPTADSVAALEKKYGKFDVVIYDMLASRPDAETLPEAPGKTEFSKLDDLWSTKLEQQGIPVGHPMFPAHMVKPKLLPLKSALAAYEVLRLFRALLARDGAIKLIGVKGFFQFPPFKDFQIRGEMVPFDYLDFQMYYPDKAVGRLELSTLVYKGGQLPESPEDLPSLKKALAGLGKLIEDKKAGKSGNKVIHVVPCNAYVETLRKFFHTATPELMRSNSGFKNLAVQHEPRQTEEQEQSDIADEYAEMKKLMLAKQRAAAAAASQPPKKRRKVISID
eukprot:TRINITY_DN4683_c0_g1_i1.p1 TRINITY_DN4683_c0_g1~~TRINITY_DN4683_c0_g1_i1.p1  ORF type:complete len:467 (+),score=141.57 TRINITY_DN4683_c0_g1_i1:185-1402(+)